ncbi:transporter substrate-binding domain-containing protein [Magnetospirillum fulvum]|uniref:Polar amino acid transport system substrate-binding protein n=1 Tax=Magnetospirillum fulvum TaxID=1082 RepID=A0A1H6HIM8_MAGFU|nr:transporter substrate-binding domain-containing protein [Magnetospirillum fulvum]SEH34962.1 polar amino acid transport system substrate-binding protein [Magnetospirillum fulvum]
MMPRRTLLGLAALCLGAAAVFALVRTDSPLSRFRAGEPFRIGYAVEPPYAFLLADGTVTGEAPEIALRIARQIGIPTIEWRQMEFGELLDALEARQIDVIAAGMFVTPERQRRALFSLPTIHVRPGLLVARGNPKDIASYHQVAERNDLRVAVLSDAVEEQIMRRLGVPEIRLLRVPDALSGRRVVETGLADALLLSEPTVRWMARTEQLGHTDMLVALTDSSDIYGATAFAFHLDAGSVREAWNAALRLYLGSPDHRALLAGLGLSNERPPDPDSPR